MVSRPRRLPSVFQALGYPASRKPERTHSQQRRKVERVEDERLRKRKQESLKQTDKDESIKDETSDAARSIKQNEKE